MYRTILNSCFYTMILIFTILGLLHAEITYIPAPNNRPHLWETDSLFLGIGFVVRNPTLEVKVIWKKNRSDALGCLYFMHPEYRDSSVFIFHNRINKFLEESTTVSVGKFPAGTPVIFKYVQTEPYYYDTTKLYFDASMVNVKLYSGQNRNDTDLYQSEKEGLYSYRWAIGGGISLDTCELIFASTLTGQYTECRFFISNVYRETLDKYQVAKPIISPTKSEFDEPFFISLISFTKGNPVIYFTTDGSNPNITSSIYLSPFQISNTTTVKAFAVMPGDTQWINSDICEMSYKKISTHNLQYTFDKNSYASKSEKFYSLNGQKISSLLTTVKNREQIQNVIIKKKTKYNNVFIQAF